MMRTYSLRLRILFGILAAVALVWSVVGAIAYREARHEAEELLDAHLAQSATLLFAFLGDEADDIGERLPRHRYDKKVAFQVWEGERLLTRSPRAPDSRLSPREEGFSDVHIDGKAWRVFSVRDARRHYLIQVADAAESRAEISNEVASHLLQTMGVGLPVLGLVLGIFVLLAFRPLSRLADSIGAQAPQRLQPISLAEAPREVVPILERLNRLFEQVRRAQDDERRFTADAAHELRTPLAVLQTHAEVAQAAGDDETRQRALAHLVSGSRRAARLVDQLLTLARLDAQAELPDQPAPCAAWRWKPWPPWPRPASTRGWSWRWKRGRKSASPVRPCCCRCCCATCWITPSAIRPPVAGCWSAARPRETAALMPSCMCATAARAFPRSSARRPWPASAGSIRAPVTATAWAFPLSRGSPNCMAPASAWEPPPIWGGWTWRLLSRAVPGSRFLPWVID